VDEKYTGTKNKPKQQQHTNQKHKRTGEANYRTCCTCWYIK